MYLDAAATERLEQNVLGLHVAVNDVMIVEQQETLEHRVRELADETDAEAVKPVLLDELVEVHRQQLEGDADVAAEREVLVDVHHVRRVVRVELAQVLQDADLLLRLPVKALLVSDHLERDARAVLVVEGKHDLSEAAFAEHSHHLVAVRNVIVRHLQAIS